MPIYDFTKQSGGVTTVGGFVHHPRTRSWGAAVAGPEAGTVVMALVSNTPTLFNATVTPGSVSAVLPLVSNAFTLFNAAITQGSAPGTLLIAGGDDLLLESGDMLLVESGASALVTALSAMTTPTDDDVIYVVDDPAGTPVSNKLTMANLKTYLLA